MTREEHLAAIKQTDHDRNPSMSDEEYDRLRRSYIDQYGSEDLDYVPGTDTTLNTGAKLDTVTRLRAQAMAFVEILRLYETETWIEKKQGFRYALEATATDILKHVKLM